MTHSALDRVDRDAVAASSHTRTEDQAGNADRELLPCRIHDPELWFAESAAEVEIAKAHCGSCPVQELCLAGALERREPWGVWGGQVFLHGAVIPRKRGRGRPRKDDPAAALKAPAASSGAGEVVTAIRSADLERGGASAPGRDGTDRARFDVLLG